MQVWVRARDGGGLASEVPLTVVVSAGSPPLPPSPAREPDYFLPENAEPGTVVAQVRGAASEARFRLAGGAWPRDLFAVTTSGALVLAGRLDRERTALHRVAIVAEAGGAAAMFPLRLHVLDDNDNAPVFHSRPYVISVAENVPAHTSLVRREYRLGRTRHGDDGD